MVDKAHLSRALSTGTWVGSLLVLVASHSDIAERRLEIVYHCMHAVEKLLGLR